MTMSSIITILSILFFFNAPTRLLHNNNAPTAPALVMAVPVEQSPAKALELHAIRSVMESIGYRKKRSNGYGDEPIPPTDILSISPPTLAEEAPEQAPEQATPPQIADAQIGPSGYRKKRSNGYGDEPIPPTDSLPISPPTLAEEAPEQAPEQATPPQIADAQIGPSGYRKKRSNGYGDEPIPPTDSLPMSPPILVEQAPEQAPGQVTLPQIADAPITPSGY